MNFNEIVETQQSPLWILELYENNWISVTCTCPFFKKKTFIVSIHGMSIRQGHLKPPPEAKNVALGL